MHRCVHIYDSGFQCVSDALESSDFCESHQKVVFIDRLENPPLRKAVTRFVALVLLSLFLVPIFYTMRDLVASARTQMRGAW